MVFECTRHSHCTISHALTSVSVILSSKDNNVYTVKRSDFQNSFTRPHLTSNATVCSSRLLFLLSLSKVSIGLKDMWCSWATKAELVDPVAIPIYRILNLMLSQFPWSNIYITNPLTLLTASISSHTILTTSVTHATSSLISLINIVYHQSLIYSLRYLDT